MPNHYGREIDRTHLSIGVAEERLHIGRDYIAHALRWSYICRYLHRGNKYKEANILEIWCGIDLPLPRLMHFSRPRSFKSVSQYDGPWSSSTDWKDLADG